MRFVIATAVVVLGLIPAAQAQTDGGTAPVQAVSTGAGARTADEAFQTRVKTLEEQVADLKQRIVMAKSRLIALQEKVLGGDLSNGARAVVYHRNELGSAFVVESAVYVLDGSPVKTLANSKDLEKVDELPIFDGRIVPGQHQVNVIMKLRGSGFGIFSYLEGYKFQLTSSYVFNAEAGKVTTVKAVAFEKGGFTTDVKDRPAIRYDISSAKDASLKRGDSSTPAAATAK